MSRSIKEMRLAEVRSDSDRQEYARLQHEHEQARVVLDALEKLNLDAARPLLVELREEAMQSLLGADDLNAMLRYQGEARAYDLLASKKQEVEEQIRSLQEDAARVSARLGEGDAGHPGDG